MVSVDHGGPPPGRREGTEGDEEAVSPVGGRDLYVEGTGVHTPEHHRPDLELGLGIVHRLHLVAAQQVYGSGRPGLAGEGGPLLWQLAFLLSRVNFPPIFTG